jgi:hypothetical protein
LVEDAKGGPSKLLLSFLFFIGTRNAKKYERSFFYNEIRINEPISTIDKHVPLDRLRAYQKAADIYR